jgi:hypothetical protein
MFIKSIENGTLEFSEQIGISSLLQMTVCIYIDPLNPQLIEDSS